MNNPNLELLLELEHVKQINILIENKLSVGESIDNQKTMDLFLSSYMIICIYGSSESKEIIKARNFEVQIIKTVNGNIGDIKLTRIK